ncbi:MAG TPA: trypsin-like peptidase domain-containing protein [Steroidobacteraceae bacterium]|nr:trypsin-like peptidase domain-containing protein [Steroidobacteraceae bacterium]
MSLATFSADIARLVAQTAPSVVALQARRSYPSSGVIVQPGVVVTAAHTLRREDGIAALTPDGTTTSATLVGVDPATDIAVLRLDSTQGTPIAFGEATDVETGHFVVAIARGGDGSVAASAGIVASTGGEWRTWRGGRLERRIQLDGGLWGGFSGGPVVGAQGGAIGIGTSALSRGRAVVIPGSALRRVSEQLLARGRVSHAYIGAAVQSVELPGSLRAQLHIEATHGLIVLSTVPQGPAEAAGITLGDTLLTLDEKPLQDVDDLKAALNAERIGQAAKVTFLRGGQLASADVVVGERPSGR